jgi:hypothetical protein
MPEPNLAIEGLEFSADAILQAGQEIMHSSEIRLIGDNFRHGLFGSSYG